MKESYVKGLANQFDNEVEVKLPETVEYVKAYSPPVGHRKDAGAASHSTPAKLLKPDFHSSFLTVFLPS